MELDSSSSRQSDDADSRKKRRKIEAVSSSSSSHNEAAHVKWRSSVAQRTYSVKLVEALQQRASQAVATPRPPPASTGGRAVRDVADRVLAMAARGRTRWSRAILASRLRRLRKAKKPLSSKPRKGKGLCPAAVAFDERKRRLPAVEKRVKVLSRLVPGCKGIPVTNLLEEAGDYIAALEMQVRAMTALTELLSGSAASQSDRLRLGLDSAAPTPP